MAKTAVTQYDSTPANNTDIGGIDIRGSAAVSNFDGAFRTLMAHLADLYNGAAAFTVTSSDAGASSGPDITLYRNSATPADSDLLGKIEWKGNNDAGTQKTVAQFYVQMADVSATTEDASLVISTISNGSTTTVATFGGGVLKAANAVEVDQATGWIIKLASEDTGIRRDPLGAVTELWADGDIVGQFAPGIAVFPGSLEITGTVSGLNHTYTPTTTGVVNVSSSTPSVSMYYILGGLVNVYGTVSITPAATGDVQLGISLPVPSNFTTFYDALGTANCTVAGVMNAGTGAIFADTTNDRVTLEYSAATTSAFNIYYHFAYQVKV